MSINYSISEQMLRKGPPRYTQNIASDYRLNVMNYILHTTIYTIYLYKQIYLYRKRKDREKDEERQRKGKVVA